MMPSDKQHLETNQNSLMPSDLAILLGLGSNRVEHVAVAEFLTIFQGEEVFALWRQTQE